MELASPTSLVFDLQKETGELTATYTPINGAEPLTPKAFNDALIAGGYDQFARENDTIYAFLEQCAQASTPQTAMVAVCRDGEYTLEISDDKMVVTLSLQPPVGGRPKNVEIIRAIQELGVKHGIMHQVLRDAIKAGQCKDLVVAMGTWPTLGKPASFDSLLEDIEKELAEVDEDAIISYSELGHLLLVSPGDKLMRRTPAIQGEDGINVLGQKVPARPVANHQFNLDCKGTMPDPDDPDLLVAATSGQPKVITNGVKVNEIVEIEHVDLSTGNVNFEGTIRVKGDIKGGMRLQASGDVFINGMVEVAEVLAGGDITIKGGIIGAIDAQPNNAGVLPAQGAKIISQTGSIQALFAQNVYIEAAKGIAISGTASQCELIAGEEILVGKKNGSKGGQIIGGRAQATNLIKAVSFGSPTATTTRIHVGSDPQWAVKLHAKEKSLDKITGDLEYTIKTINHIKQSKKPEEQALLPELDAKRLLLVEEVRELNTEIKDMKDGYVPMDQARIVATKMIHEGVEIRIGKQALLVSSDLGKGTLRLQQDRIALGK
jgi:uncharacterized protein (DUF342 family)